MKQASFRIDGRMLERRVNIGDRVKAGQLVARLDPLIQQNALRSAQANLSAAQGQLTQARNTFERQQALVEKGFTTRVQFDQAQAGLQQPRRTSTRPRPSCAMPRNS